MSISSKCAVVVTARIPILLCVEVINIKILLTTESPHTYIRAVVILNIFYYATKEVYVCANAVPRARMFVTFSLLIQHSDSF